MVKTHRDLCGWQRIQTDLRPVEGDDHQPQRHVTLPCCDRSLTLLEVKRRKAKASAAQIQVSTNDVVVYPIVKQIDDQAVLRKILRHFRALRTCGSLSMSLGQIALSLCPEANVFVRNEE